MMDNLIPIAVALITFALIIGVGQVVLYNFAGSQCANPFGTWNSTSGHCQNGTVADSAGNYSDSTATSTTITLAGYVGNSSGGLVTWVTAIIALTIGVLFIAGIMMLRGRKY